MQESPHGNLRKRRHVTVVIKFIDKMKTRLFTLILLFFLNFTFAITSSVYDADQSRITSSQSITSNNGTLYVISCNNPINENQTKQKVILTEYNSELRNTNVTHIRIPSEYIDKNFSVSFLKYIKNGIFCFLIKNSNNKESYVATYSVNTSKLSIISLKYNENTKIDPDGIAVCDEKILVYGNLKSYYSMSQFSLDGKLLKQTIFRPKQDEIFLRPYLEIISSENIIVALPIITESKLETLVIKYSGNLQKQKEQIINGMVAGITYLKAESNILLITNSAREIGKMSLNSIYLDKEFNKLKEIKLTSNLKGRSHDIGLLSSENDLYLSYLSGPKLNLIIMNIKTCGLQKETYDLDGIADSINGTCMLNGYPVFLLNFEIFASKFDKYINDYYIIKPL